MSDDSTGIPSAPPPPWHRPSGGTHRRPLQGDHREYKSEHRNERHRSGRPAHAPNRCVALIDGHFWAWLQEDQADGGSPVPGDIRDQLNQLLAQVDPDAQLARVVWYTDEGSPARHSPGIIVRQVPSNAQDGGVTMLRGMAQEMSQLAQRQGADRLVLVSDDERLLLAVDDAQRSGLMVDMVVDAESTDWASLRQDDPQWARLLMLADRLLVLGAPGVPREASPRDRTGARETRLGPQAPSDHASQVIDEEIHAWWSEESPTQKEHWRAEIQSTRGIPQELDRQLLLRVSRRLGQALTPPEKNAMRALARRCIQADPQAIPESPMTGVTPLPADG